jgi:hypothetical protein
MRAPCALGPEKGCKGRPRLQATDGPPAPLLGAPARLRLSMVSSIAGWE